MKTYKHYSFDLWLTLIKSNPVFKKERALFFHKHLNADKKSLEEVEMVFRRVDLMSNAINQKTGSNLNAEEMYLMVIYEINGSNSTFENLDIKWLLHEIEQLFFQYIPTIYNAETLPTLNILKEIPDVSMNILSNTAFIKGSTLRVVLKHLGLDQFFNFQCYSDEVGMSKPNPQFFGLMIDKVQAIRPNDNISLQEIIHIGDNFVADILGAKYLKINGFLINSNNNTIADLLK
ncbi:MAG: HAD family hydrolase [Arcicella sp.]|nr:HAD family hydrolase [Arcicella sp.]